MLSLLLTLALDFHRLMTQMSFYMPYSGGVSSVELRYQCTGPQPHYHERAGSGPTTKTM